MDSEPLQRGDCRAVAEAVREACARAAMAAFDDAAVSGLCHEGAAECAVGAIRAVDLEALLAALTAPKADATDRGQ